MLKLHETTSSTVKTECYPVVKKTFGNNFFSEVLRRTKRVFKNSITVSSNLGFKRLGQNHRQHGSRDSMNCRP